MKPVIWIDKIVLAKVNLKREFTHHIDNTGNLTMKEFFRENFKMIFWTTVFFIAVGGGIYYVEAALEAQVQVID